MDAHTLNAWTRFALQKGGIGSCTALIDNPATEPEDLMFMTGEKIIVLRRLDDESGTGEGSSSSNGHARRKSGHGDPDTWFLGYCEGVVGRFKGGHVQFHGKLKKPVLMRRSGVGQIRDSTTRPMSKSEAAHLDASQVPPGMPVTTVDSDGEDASTNMSHARDLGRESTVVQTGSRRSSEAATGRPRNGSASNRKGVPTGLPPNLISRAAGLGVTTPPLSDDNHARRVRESYHSDESETLLPWARPDSVGSSAESTSGSRSRSEAHASNTRHPNAAAKPATLANGHLPPSPISSAESPISGRSIGAQQDVGGTTPRAGAPNGHLSNASSLETSGTSESDHDYHRRDQTFSIYDVYGRDSVAFPNFNYKDAANGMLGDGTHSKHSSRGIATSRSQDSLAAGGRGSTSRSGASTPEPRTPVDRRPLMPPEPVQAISPRIPAALRTPSGRRPNAAPDPRVNAGAGSAANVASSLRRKVEASAGLPAPNPVSSPPRPTAGGGPGSFDPLRRPSVGNTAPIRSPSALGRGGVRASTDSSMTSRSMRPPLSIVPPGFAPPGHANAGPVSAPVAPGPGFAFAPPMGGTREPLPPGSLFGPPGASQVPPGPRMQRPGFADSRSRSQSASGLAIDPNAANDMSMPPPIGSAGRTGSAYSTGDPARNSARSPGFGPVRASSDRTSVRERVGSGQLKKNPSNPGPGPHGGMPAMSTLAPASAGPGVSRSPSPLSATSAHSDGPPRSPMGPPFQGQGMRVNSASPLPDDGRPVAYDALGFLLGPHPTVLPRDDAEAVEQWNRILTENDVVAARKSRKVKKMVQAGIPHSLRARVWLFLSNSTHRRRPGLFEQLCKTSQGPKGKKGKEEYYDAIDKDLDRCYPDHKIFRGEGSTGRADLEAILKAYVHYNPIIGYTQGMGLVAGLMLILMPAEDAFWLLCALLRDVHMEGYYSNNMKQLHVDGVVFGQLLASMDSPLTTRLTEMAIEPINFTPNWFLPLFARVLPWGTLLHTWDVFFFEGPSWLLRTALAIIRIVRDPLLDPRAIPGHGEGMALLLHPPRQLLSAENVIGCAITVKLKEGEMRKLSRNASKLVRESMTRGRPGSRPTTPASNASAPRSTSVPAPKR